MKRANKGDVSQSKTICLCLVEEYNFHSQLEHENLFVLEVIRDVLLPSNDLLKDLSRAFYQTCISKV